MLSGVLPHSRIILTNYLVVAYLVFESSIIDLVSLLVRVETPLIGAISAGALLGIVLPFAEVWVRYAGSLGQEFVTWERDFRESIPKPPEADP
jgi:hypothetical protein